MKKTTLVLFLLTVTIIQITVLNSVKFFGAKPDLMLITVVFFALRFGPGYGFWVGFLCGLLQDALSGLPFGAATGAFSLCGLTIGTFSNVIFRDSKFVQASIVFICAAISYIFYVYILKSNSDILGIHMPFSKILVSCLYTSVVSPPLIFILNRTAVSLSRKFA